MNRASHSPQYQSMCFFVGIRRARGGGGERGGYPGKAAALRMSATKKRNPFYTASERAAEEYFTKLDKGEVVEETEEEALMKLDKKQLKK